MTIAPDTYLSPNPPQYMRELRGEVSSTLSASTVNMAAAVARATLAALSHS